ncbi:MAG TPA: hypothetical protein VK907_06700 [Phnomibacter sp.]|nr:hypothetical protein [Phnomibacter sp.]
MQAFNTSYFLNKVSSLAIMLTIFVAYGCSKDGASADAKTFQGKGGSMARFAVQGPWLYTVDMKQLRTYDLADPANPKPVHTQDVGFEIETIFPFGDKLFIGSTSVIHIFSLDDPAKPQKLSTAISPTVMRRCDPVVAKDSVAYATLRSGVECGGIQSILAVFDIRNITAPVQRQAITLQAPRGLGYADTILYVCDPPGLKLYNISNAWEPQFISTITGDEYFDVIPYGGLLFAWTKTGGRIFNIQDPAAPVQISQLQ